MGIKLPWNFIIPAIIIMLISLYYYIDTKKIHKSYQNEIELIKKKHTAQLDSVIKEYDKLSLVYLNREKENEIFREKQQEYINEIEELTKLIKEDPEGAKFLYNESMDNFMKEMYNETLNDTNH